MPPKPKSTKSFQSTLSMRRATACGLSAMTVTSQFQSTLSMRRATSQHKHNHHTSKFQSTLSMRRATLRFRGDDFVRKISIHALHEESDFSSPHSSMNDLKFQSTLSMRRATFRQRKHYIVSYISIHALHEESDSGSYVITVPFKQISIHALHEESDRWREHPKLGALYISIHALHEESDCVAHGFVDPAPKFQSTLSMRRATHSYTFSKTFHNISIHALHEESDDNTPSNDSFNDVISIHALHEESDWREHPKLGALYISIHALHEESDRIRYGQHNQQVRFQSTLSMRRATSQFFFNAVKSCDFNPRSP